MNHIDTTRLIHNAIYETELSRMEYRHLCLCEFCQDVHAYFTAEKDVWRTMIHCEEMDEAA